MNFINYKTSANDNNNNGYLYSSSNYCISSSSSNSSGVSSSGSVNSSNANSPCDNDDKLIDTLNNIDIEDYIERDCVECNQNEDDDDNDNDECANLPTVQHQLENDNLHLKKANIIDNLINDNRVLQNLLNIENNYCIQSNYFMYIQNEIKPWMRNVLANWMLEVCDNQRCEEDVFVLAMNILDRFLSVQLIGKRHLQLLGTVCMFIASKLRCAVSLNAETLVIYTDRSITIEEILVRNIITNFRNYLNMMF